jgi:nucleoside-diphosphate-sugar epimerase
VRIFLAGATGVLGLRVVPLLVGAGHDVVGMTRSPAKADDLVALGAMPVVCDAFDHDRLVSAVVDAAPDLVLHELTDLPDDPDLIPEVGARNVRMRTEGTDNLLTAMRAAGTDRIVAQSIAWTRGGASAAAVEHLERSVLAVHGVVLRYGQFYGPGTYFPDAIPDEPRVSLDRAAAATVDALDLSSGTYVVTD